MVFLVWETMFRAGPAATLRCEGNMEMPGGQVIKDQGSKLCQDATDIQAMLEDSTGFPTGLK